MLFIAPLLDSGLPRPAVYLLFLHSVSKAEALPRVNAQGTHTYPFTDSDQTLVLFLGSTFSPKLIYALTLNSVHPTYMSNPTNFLHPRHPHLSHLSPRRSLKILLPWHSCTWIISPQTRSAVVCSATECGKDAGRPNPFCFRPCAVTHSERRWPPCEDTQASLGTDLQEQRHLGQPAPTCRGDVLL